ncbi:MAG: hypothetical protein AAF525_13785 [Pseudomonadota bacterium]
MARISILLGVLVLLAGCTSADVFNQVQHNLQQSCERKLGEPLCVGEHDVAFVDCQRKFGADLCRRPFALTYDDYAAERKALRDAKALDKALDELTSAVPAPDNP